MSSLIGAVRKKIFTPPPSEVQYEERGFDTTSAPARTQLEMSALQFIMGFEYAIEFPDNDAIITRLECLEREYRGFAYEGAVMGLTLRDVISPRSGNKLTESFLSGPAPQHIFMAYIGIGFALARLPKFLWKRALPDQSKLPDHPTLNWLIVDGYGFHMAFFDTKKWVDQQYVGRSYPWPGPADYTNRVIDQGIGRAMWFIGGGDVERIAHMIGKFAPHRQSDLWSGCGLAAAYAGGVGAEDLELFYKLSGEHRPVVAQGAVFAIKARVLADLVVPHTETAAQVLCEGRTADEASELADLSVIDLPETASIPPYEIFRQRIQASFQK